MHDGLARQQLWQGTLRRVDRYRVSHPHEHPSPRWVLQGRVYPDHLTAGVDEGPPGVAGIDGGVRLDELPDGTLSRLRQRAVEAADDPFRDRPLQPKRVADGDDALADAYGVRVAERGRRQLLRRP